MMFNIIEIVKDNNILVGIAINLVCFIIGCFITYKSVYSKYKHDYFEIMLKRKIDAYEGIEKQLETLSMTTYDKQDRKPYYTMFDCGKNSFQKMQTGLILSSMHSIYIANETMKIIDEFNEIFRKIDLKAKTDEELIDEGKRNYKIIAMLKRRLIDRLNHDYRNMYKFKNLFEKPKHYTKILTLDKSQD